MNNITALTKTPTEINNNLADKLRRIRKRQKISQQALSEKSGVSLGSIKRFETTGNISLISFAKIAFVLGVSEDIENLFTNSEIKSIQDIINEE